MMNRRSQVTRRSLLANVSRLAGATALAGGVSGLLSPRGARTARASAELRTLRMQSAWVSDAEFMGYFVAFDQGWYEEEGLDYVYLPGGPDVIPETTLLAEQADVALTTIEGVAKLVQDEGAPLKVIGTQYQKNPSGVVSLVGNNITTPEDLAGRTLAISPVGQITFEAFFALNDMDISDVDIVPYAYDPTPLVNGEVDATGDFVTNVPFSIMEAGGDPTSFLLYDYGLKFYNDTVVVREDTLEERRDDLVAFLRASRRGWVENFVDTTAYIPMLKDTFGADTGRSAANEEYFNDAQKPLIEHADGIFALSEEGIAENIETLALVGITASPDLFVTDLLEEI